MTKTLKMTYTVPTAEGFQSIPHEFQTSDGKEWERAVNVAHENGYRILKVEKVEA